MPGSENRVVELSFTTLKIQVIMFFYVYVLESAKDGRLYIGSTTDLRKRLKEHNQGSNFSTKPYRPWRIIYSEAGLNEDDAKRREKYLKTNQGARFLKRRIKEYLYSRNSKKS